jgi:hypothetical protein
VQANSWPFVQLGSGNATDDGAHELSFNLENVGTGPARIHTFDFEVDGEPINRQGNYLYELLNSCCSTEFEAAVERAGGDRINAVGHDLTSPASSRFLAPNNGFSAIRWGRTEQNLALWTALDHARQTGRITMTACYCSVFDECWIARSHRFPPEQVANCEPPPAASRPAHPNP